jgi:hypothetical protein
VATDLWVITCLQRTSAESFKKNEKNEARPSATDRKRATGNKLEAVGAKSLKEMVANA